ncbi:MAG: hypothetical protein FJX76_29140 [Armatimonadetes bacterium]|nr:hypothetical protein [Armatimonadota bacterium]
MPGGGPPGEGPRGRGPRDGPPGIPTYQISLPSDWVAVQTVGEQSPPRVRYELKSPQLGDSAAMRLYVMDVPDDRLSSCYANTQHQVMTEGWQLEAPREVGGATVIPMRRNGWVGELQMRRQSSNGRTTRVLATVIMAASSGNEAVSMQRMRQVAESYFR